MTARSNRMNMALLVAIGVSCASCSSCHPAASSGDAATATPPVVGATPSSAPAAPEGPVAVPLGDGSGVGFDDLGFAPAIRKVLAPAGATGNLALVDPDRRQVTLVPGFAGSKGAYDGGHDDGTTSADEGRGLLFAIDRTAQLLDVIDPAARAIVASARLAGSPDYVRWVESTSEVWVTEPDRERIEVFTVPPGPKPAPVHALDIPVKGGPESLVVDARRKRAFTHLWRGSTVAIDLGSHAAVAKWPNGCDGSRGIALDALRGFVFAACAEGKLVVRDVEHDGKQLGAASSGSGVDVIAYSPALAHVYLPGATSATMAVVGISAAGEPTVLGTTPTAAGAHCVAADDRRGVWVCDPERGRLLFFKDSYPASYIPTPPGARSAPPAPGLP